jgi:predicted SnoaL-like aldol condensation-catalyzing enzyme
MGTRSHRRFAALAAIVTFQLCMISSTATAQPGWAAARPGNGPNACVQGKAQLDRNTKTAIAFYETSFNDGQPALAVELYVGVDANGQKLYIQHNPSAQDGPVAFIAFVTFFKTLFPDLNINIVRTVAECDLVITHGHVTFFPGHRGLAAMDIFRFDNTGRIVEHWDVVQEVPEESLNDNGMF